MQFSWADAQFPQILRCPHGPAHAPLGPRRGRAHFGLGRSELHHALVPINRPRDRSRRLLVLDDFGPLLGQAWRETDVHDANFESVIADMLNGEYTNPISVIAFNTAKGSSHDISNVVALELRTRCEHQGRELPESPATVRGASRERQGVSSPRSHSTGKTRSRHGPPQSRTTSPLLSVPAMPVR